MKKNFFKRNIYTILVFLLLCDVGFSGYQYYHQALDGDLAAIVLPYKAYTHVLKDPFGITVVTQGASYPATNRFFAHATMSGYYKTMPLLLQKFTTPINSIYLSSAIAKTCLHFFLVLMLGIYISGQINLRKKELLIAMLLVTPLFHNGGSGMYLGFIGYSITYAFFYALPLGLLMLFFLPYFLETFHGRDHLFKPWVILLLMLLGVVLAFNGPLVPPVLLLICPVILLVKWWHNFKEVQDTSLRNIFISWRKIPVKYSLVFTFIIMLCLYSLYLGTHNSENEWSQIPLFERYSRLLTGFWELIVYKTGIPILLIGVVANIIILIRHSEKSKMKSRILLSLYLVLIFGFIYLALLPFGGYREYRPFIIRDDTAMPFLLGLVLWWGVSTYYLLHTFSNRRFNYYLIGVIVFLVIFISNDPAHFGHYKCERSAIEELAASQENLVKLSADCPIMGWRIITKPESSTSNCAMLKYWGIIDGDKLYYQDK